MIKNKFNTLIDDTDDNLLESCLYEAFQDILSAKMLGDAPKFFTRCYAATRYGKDVTVLQIPYTSGDVAGRDRNIEQKAIEDLSLILHEGGFLTSFDQEGMEIMLDKDENDISKFCEFAILLHPDQNKKLASRIMMLQRGLPASQLILN